MLVNQPSHQTAVPRPQCDALSAQQVAKVDAFQLSQYELYSSRVKDFEVRGRQSHPRGQGSDYSKALNTSGWQLLGKYTAAKTRGTQVTTDARLSLHHLQCIMLQMLLGYVSALYIIDMRMTIS